MAGNCSLGNMMANLDELHLLEDPETRRSECQLHSRARKAWAGEGHLLPLLLAEEKKVVGPHLALHTWLFASFYLRGAWERRRGELAVEEGRSYSQN